MASRLAAALDSPDLLARVLPHMPRSPSVGAPLPRVAVGLSGGVDSAVAAWLLKTAGFDVTGVLMRNWDEAEETGGECTFEKDQRDARAVAAHLGIPLREVDFVKEYWHSVFEPFLRDFEGGAATPNPDLACNRHIKFGALLRHCETALGADILATGHYARVARGSLDDPHDVPRLLRGVDPRKDQSYFLASVRGEALRRACFPLGGLTKTEVKALASGPASMPTAVTSRRSSAGICFIGRKRDFGDFIHEYVSDGDASGSRVEENETSTGRNRHAPGRFVSVEDGSTVGEHRGLARYTVGQRARVGGAPVPWYVVGKDATPGVDIVFVAPGPDHPALFASSAAVGRCFWVAGRNPFGDGRRHGEKEDRDRVTRGTRDDAAGGASVRLRAQTRYGAEAVACEVRLVPRGEAPALVPTSRGSPPEPRDHADDGDVVEVYFDTPERAVTPGQAMVLYDGEACLGGGVVLYSGLSSHESAAKAGSG